PARGQVCSECRMPWPAPDSSGLCRYCRLARAEASPAPHAGVRIELVSTPPRPATRRRVAGGSLLTLYLIACALVQVPGSPGFFLFLGLFIVLMSYRAFRKERALRPPRTLVCGEGGKHAEHDGHSCPGQGHRGPQDTPDRRLIPPRRRDTGA